MCDKQSPQKSDHDKHVRIRNFKFGDRVRVKNFCPGPNWVPGTITQQHGQLSFTVCTENGQLWKRHSDHIQLTRLIKRLKHFLKSHHPHHHIQHLMMQSHHQNNRLNNELLMKPSSSTTSKIRELYILVGEECGIFRQTTIITSEQRLVRHI